MKKITLFLIAIFAMVNVANAQRAWAYDLELTPSSESYTFSFKAVTAGDATLVFYKEGVEAGTLNLGSVSAGDNTVTKTSEELLAAIQQSGNFTWGVKMSAGAIAAGSTLKEVTDQTRGIYDFYNMMDVLVDNDPESDYFSKIYIQAALDGKSDGATTRSDNQKAGLFIYDQELNELNPTSNVGIKPTLPSGYSLGDNRNMFHRLEIDPKTGNLAYCYNVSGSPAVFSIDRANPTGEVTNLMDGVTGLTQTCALCFDAEGTLYVMDLASSKGTIYKVVAGQKTAFSETTGKWVNASMSLAADGKGGIWVAQNRGQMDTYYQLAHVSASGVTDYKVYQSETNGFTGSAARGALAYDAERHILAQGRNGAVELFNVTYNASGVPTLTKFAVTPTVGSNIDGLHFDYAGDLYVVNSSKEKFQKFVVPTTNNTCTVPAKKSQVITLVSATPEHTVTISVNGNGTVTGANTGKYLEGTELTLTPTPAEHYEFTGWTGDVNSTDNPLTITVNSDMTVTANFQEHTKYTITAVANDENMGTVTGGREYYVGESATLKATAKSGYVFAGWADGEKNATRTVTVSGNATYTANFQAIAPRAWAYDLKVAENGENYEFTFKATAAGSATLLFADIDGNPVAPTSRDGGLVNAGDNTILVDKAAFTENKDVYWSVKMDGEAIPAISEITDVSKGIYNFYLPQGVAVDNNPESPTFSKIYIAESTDGASDGGSDRADNQKRGIFIYDQTLVELNPTNKGIIPSNVTLTNTTRNALKRIAINPKTNEVAFAYNASPAAVWAVSTENVAGEATNLIEGLRFEYCNSLCFDENGILYIFDNGAGYPTKGSLYKIVNGEKKTIFSANSKYGNADNSLASDGRGGLWIYQNRGQLDAFNQLSHINANGEIDFEVNSTTPHDFESLNTSRGAMAYNPRENILAIGIGASGTIGVSLYQVTYDPSTGVPSLEYIGATPSLGKNVEGIAFDYAGDLYALSANAERFYKFTLPTDENICTVPAPSSQKLVLGTQCEVTVTVNDPAMGSVEGAGQYEKGAEVTLTPNPVAHHRFVNWTGDKTSTDNPLKFTIEGNVNLTANFAELPKYTITVNVNDNAMGSVTGGETVYVGESVTLTATPNPGHAFVKWDDGNTEATRTVVVEGNKTYTAIFQAIVPRAWTYDLRLVEEGDNYKFTFKATSAGDATLLFTNEAGTPVAPTSYSVGAVEAGEKSVTLAKSQFGGTEDIYWSVQMDGAAIENMIEITDASGNYDFFMPQDVKVDNSPNSMYFGQIYVAAAQDGACRGGNQKRGIFVYNQILEELNTSNEGYLPANATLTDATRHAIHRLAVNPINGYVAFAYNVSGSSAVWSMNPADMSGNAVNLIDNSITAANSICFDEDGALYVLNNANTSTGGNIYKILNGTAGVFANAQNGCTWGNTDNALAPDGRGGLWIAQNRWQLDGYPVLSHVDKDGIVDFAVTLSSPEALKALFPYDDNNASYRGQCAYYAAEDILAFGGNKEAVLFKVTYDTNNVPTNLEKLMSTGKLGTHIDGLAFDYAGDLYVASETSKRFYKFVVPTNTNTCTVPAPESQVIQKETKYTVTVVANPAEGGIVSVSDGGNAVEGATLEVTATANTGYRFVNWTKNAEEISTSASFEYTVPAEDVTLTANFAPLPVITYELNGGVWNQFGWTSKKDMYNALLDDWRAYSGSTRTNVSYEEQHGIGNSSKGIPTTITSAGDRVALMELFTDATYAPKWGWLATYVDAVAATQYKKMDVVQGVKTQPTSAAGVFTFTIGNFFGEDNAHSTDYIDAVDFTGAEAHITAFAPYWGQTFPMPTQPTEEVVLNAPYREGYEFDGWYTTSDFSGAAVTTVDENTDGTLYAKWIETIIIVTIGEDVDNTTTLAPYVGKKVTATVTRNFGANKILTVTLPFDMSASQISTHFGNATVYEFYNVVDAGEELHLQFTHTNSIEAGKPYILQTTSGYDAEDGFTIENVTINTERTQVKIGDLTMVPVLDGGGTLNQPTQYYLSNNALYCAGDYEQLLPGLRAFFTSASSTPIRARVIFDDNGATSIPTVIAPETKAQKIIQDGRLIIIRGEHQYDAQGQMIE